MRTFLVSPNFLRPAELPNSRLADNFGLGRSLALPVGDCVVKTMLVTKREVVEKLLAYLNGRIGLSELVDWAEEVMREGDFAEEDYETLRDIVARLGLADVVAFGLTWEDCVSMLQRLDYRVSVEVSPLT